MHFPPGWTILFQVAFHQTDRALGMMLMVLVLANTDAVVGTTARLISVKLKKKTRASGNLWVSFVPFDNYIGNFDKLNIHTIA